MHKYLFLLIAFVLFPVQALAVSTVVSSPTAFYTDEAKSNVIRTLGKGEIIDVIHSKGSLQYIRDPFGRKGWMISSAAQSPVDITPAKTMKKDHSPNTGVYLYDARVRQGMSTATAIVTVIPKGTTVSILSEHDGWYKIKDANGTIGYTATWLIEKTQKTQPTETPIAKKPLINASSKTATTLYNSRVRSSKSTGNNIITVLPKGTTVTILETYDGWYNITNNTDITGYMMDWVLSLNDQKSKRTDTPPTIQKEDSTQVESSAPAGVDEDALNQYWLEKINTLRAEAGLRLLVLDDRWKATAQEYAKYMGETGSTGHERADGSSMHDWIDQKNLDFTTRYSPNGWQTNYFTENISWGYADGTTASVKKVLDRTLDFYLEEASYNGAHYRTIYHPDWNSVGSGFYFKPQGNGTYKVSAVFHYGSLNLK